MHQWPTAAFLAPWWKVINIWEYLMRHQNIKFYIVVACNPMTTWYALYQLLPIGVICIWSKYNTERQSHLLSRHFSPAPSFHSPFLSSNLTGYLQFPVLSLSPLFFTFMFLSPCFFPFTYLPMQRIEMLVKVYSFHPLLFLSTFSPFCLFEWICGDIYHTNMSCGIFGCFLEDGVTHIQTLGRSNKKWFENCLKCFLILICRSVWYHILYDGAGERMA